MILQPLLNIAALCAARGLRRAVIGPGSRSAALSLAFARHPDIETFVVADERSAAYLALGMAQQSGRPTVLICTSGTAALNFAPAVAEAFFLQVPLLVLTADRPAEWVGQQDGQTIFQPQLYGPHVKFSASLPADYQHDDALWFIERIINQCVNMAEMPPPGPVHVNVPIREPFYPEASEAFVYSLPRLQPRLAAVAALPAATATDLFAALAEAEQVVVLFGQQRHDPALTAALLALEQLLPVVVIGDLLANLHQEGDFIRHADFFMKTADEQLRPGLLITAGGQVLSKNLKNFLRKYPPRQHWHLDEGPALVDTFQSLTLQVPLKASCFFGEWLRRADYTAFLENDAENGGDDFLRHYRQAEQQARRRTAAFLQAPEHGFHDLLAVSLLLEALPEPSQLHLANSLSVRYAQLAGLAAGRAIEVFGNRGTSGIDGCVSTAVGAALVSPLPVTLLTGDVAFFYDRNGLWHPHLPNHLRVVVLNNGGGSIFRQLDGSGRQPELERLFETRHNGSARRTALDAGMAYFEARDAAQLQALLADFFQEKPAPALLEIFTDPVHTAAVMAGFRAGRVFFKDTQ